MNLHPFSPEANTSMAGQSTAKFKKIQMTIRVSPEIKEKVEKVASCTRRSVANFVELCLEKSIQEFQTPMEPMTPKNEAKVHPRKTKGLK